MNILLTNDDGFESPSYLPLARVLAKEFEVSLVAPAGERSWIGKSITAGRFVEYREQSIGEFPVTVVDGTPADCTQVALYSLLKSPPAMIVSGINLGLNSGNARILSSGTIGAAAEGALGGIRSIASSIDIPRDALNEAGNFKPYCLEAFEVAAQITANVAKALLQKEFTDFDIVSINMPFDVSLSAEWRITKPHRVHYGRLFHGNNGKVKVKAPPIDYKEATEGTDLHAISQGYVALTPISLDLSTDRSIQSLRHALKDSL